MSKQQQSAIRANTSPHINGGTVSTLFVFALCHHNLRSETEGHVNGILTGSMNGPAVGSYK